MFVMALSAHAQEASGSAQKYGITFPVEQLGNCKSLSECKTFCEDPLNHDACINFAKKKGFYKPGLPANAGKANVLIAAHLSPGCFEYEKYQETQIRSSKMYCFL